MGLKICSPRWTWRNPETSKLKEKKKRKRKRRSTPLAWSYNQCNTQKTNNVSHNYCGRSTRAGWRRPTYEGKKGKGGCSWSKQWWQPNEPKTEDSGHGDTARQRRFDLDFRSNSHVFSFKYTLILFPMTLILQTTLENIDRSYATILTHNSWRCKLFDARPLP